MALQIPGYVIHREIGAGGMAKVFLATQTSLDRQVALKVMSPALATDPTFAKRFQREARTIAGLTHPNIVAVYEVGSVQHMHFFAMQHLAGGDLAGKLRRGIPEPELVRILCGVARALGFAHSRGVVHRDVTPGNILFDSTDNPVLTDFGIARSQQGSTRITHTGVSIGTSSYMSPEQARGGEVDARSDLYSLGALLFETLTGKPPYTGTDGFAVAYAHVFEPIPRLSPGLEHWQPLIEKAMAKSPEDRFANSEEFVAAMQQVPTNAQRQLPLVLKGSEGRNGAMAALPAHAHTSAQQVATVPAGKLPPAATVRPAPAPAPAPVPAPALPPEASVPTQRVQFPVAVAAPPQAPAPAPARLPVPRPAADAVVVSNTAETEIPVLPRKGPGLAIGVVLAVLLLGTGLAWWQGWWPFAPAAPVIVNGDAPVADPPVVSSSASSASASASSVSSLAAVSSSEGSVSSVPDDPIVSVNLDGDGNAQIIDPVVPAEDLQPGADGTEVTAADEPFVGPPTLAEFLKPYLNWAGVLLKRGTLITPPGQNAFDVYRSVLRFDPVNAAARQGVLETAQALEKLALEAYGKKDLAQAMDQLTKADVVARTLGPKEPLLVTLAQHPKAWLEERAKAAGELEVRWKADEADQLYQEMLQIDKNSVAAAEGRKRTAVLGKPGYRFTDALKVGGRAPAMVVVAAGSVTLRDDRGGSLAAKVGKSFAIAQREVSVGEFKAYVNATGRAPGADKGCKDREGFQMFVSRERTWQNPGFTQTDRHPVVCISARDADGYARWLSEQTGHRYALPSEPQWWLAAGNLPTADCKRANLGDAAYAEQQKGRRTLGCNDGHGAAAPVGSFPAGANSLYDMAGNVREWTADCFLRTVTGRGATEAAWTGGSCGERLILGSAWVSGSEDNAAVPRLDAKPVDLGNTVGFRVVMELP